MNKKGQESGAPEMLMDVGRLVFTAITVIILIAVGVGVWNVFYGSNSEVKKSFNTLDDAIQTTIATGKESIIPFYLSDKFDLVAFDNINYNVGRYEKPAECGSKEYCLVVCKNGLISLKDNCKNPIIYKTYPKYIIQLDTNNPVLINGINGVIMVNVNITNNLDKPSTIIIEPIKK